MSSTEKVWDSAVNTYYAFGLGIQSNLLLPELQTREAACNVQILSTSRMGDVTGIWDSPPVFKLDHERAVFPIDGAGVFGISNGSRIVIQPESIADESLLRLYLFGTVITTLLYQRGRLVLHAGSVEINQTAVAIMGSEGSGKSSVVAGLYARGHAVIADDVVPVKTSQRSLDVCPGFPQLKLARETALLLDFDPSSLFLLHSTEEKLGCRLLDGFSLDPLPLRNVYVLTDDVAGRIRPLSPRDAFLELMRHSCPTRWALPGGGQHFLQCARLANQTPFYQIGRGHTLQSLPEICRILEHHAIHEVPQRID